MGGRDVCLSGRLPASRECHVDASLHFSFTLQQALRDAKVKNKIKIKKKKEKKKEIIQKHANTNKCLMKSSILPAGS